MIRTKTTLGLLAMAVVLGACSQEAPLSGRLLAMGPDPGGKSGQGVTPDSTATGHPAAPGPQREQPAKQTTRDNGNDSASQGNTSTPAPAQGSRERKD
jgi:hypothetical protein